MRSLRFALVKIPVTLNKRLKLKSIYKPANIEGFLRCRVGADEARQFCEDYDKIKIVADQYQVPSELFEQLRSHDSELDDLDKGLADILFRLNDIIKARTSDTESEIKKNISSIKEIKPLWKLYDNINQAFPHLNNEMQKIW